MIKSEPKVLCAIYVANDEILNVGMRNPEDCPEEFQIKASKTIKDHGLSTLAQKFTGHIWLYSDGTMSFMRVT